jgi:hypothetical protein
LTLSTVRATKRWHQHKRELSTLAHQGIDVL